MRLGFQEADSEYTGWEDAALRVGRLSPCTCTRLPETDEAMRRCGDAVGRQGTELDLDEVRAGKLTPVYFG